MNKVVFPGSFDPFTRGHESIVSRALKVFDHVVIAVGVNENKKEWIPAQERVRALRELYWTNNRVSVECYSGLTTDFACQQHASAILRGIRSIKDMEYEKEMADVNARLTGMETVFLLAEPAQEFLSSSMVRELVHFGKDIRKFLPDGLFYNEFSTQY